MRSIGNKLHALKAFMAYYKPDILAVTESWGRQELFDSLISLPGFSLFRRDRLERLGGGVFVLARNDLMPIEYSSGNDDGILFEESVWCTVKVSPTTSLLIGCIYRSPSSSSLNDETMCSMISDACSSFDGVKMILGDFNCPGVNWDLRSSQPISQFLLDCCNDNFLHQMVTVPTRGNSILDLVFVDDTSCVAETVVQDPFPGSDHNSVCVNLMFDGTNVFQDVKSPNASFDYAKADWDFYRAELSCIDEEKLFDSEDVNFIWETIKRNILSAASLSIPMKKKPKFFKGTPLTGDVLRAFRARKRVFQQTRLCSSQLSADLRVKAEKRLFEAIRNSRAAYENKIASACKTDVKCFWRHVRASLAYKPRVSRVVASSGSLTESDFDTAECFNKFFASVFTLEDSDAPNITPRSGKILCRLEIHIQDVAMIVQGLPNKSSPGPDGITYLLVKEGGYKLFGILARFYDLLLSKGEIPFQWKQACVVPIHKKGSLSKCENYRPISLTCVVCKILEAIIKNAILDFLLNNNLLNSSQHGFLPQRSSSTALLDFLEDISFSVDNGDNVDAVYLDFRKAFDSVPHKRLIAKIESYGVGEPLISWIRSFLTNREQFVKIGSTVSQSMNVASGVPQGSILGPLLFLIYINDIDDIIQSASIIKFADDIRLYMTFSNELSFDRSPRLLQDDLSRVLRWSETWLLSLNTTKCSCIHFGPSNALTKYYLDRDLLLSTSEELDLGIKITSDLKPSTQCQRAAARANKILGCIKLAFKYLNSSSLLQLYKALVLPHLDYCSVAWCPYYARDIEVLEKVQRRMTRFLPELRDLPYDERLKSLNLLTLFARRIRHDLIFVYKLFHGKINLDTSKFFTAACERRTRGHNYKLQLNFSRLNARKNFFSQRVINSWNDLPFECVNAPSLSSFKVALSQYFERKGIR